MGSLPPTDACIPAPTQDRSPAPSARAACPPSSIRHQTSKVGVRMESCLTETTSDSDRQEASLCVAAASFFDPARSQCSRLQRQGDRQRQGETSLRHSPVHSAPRCCRAWTECVHCAGQHCCRPQDPHLRAKLVTILVCVWGGFPPKHPSCDQSPRGRNSGCRSRRHLGSDLLTQKSRLTQEPRSEKPA